MRRRKDGREASHSLSLSPFLTVVASFSFYSFFLHAPIQSISYVIFIILFLFYYFI